MLRRWVMLASAAWLSICVTGCEEVWNTVGATRRAGDLVAERCSAGREEELALPLDDAKIDHTLRAMAAIAAVVDAGPPADPEQAVQALITATEAGGLACGPQVTLLAKLYAAIEQLRARRALPPLRARPHEGGSTPGGETLGGDAGRAAASLREGDLALVDARFDEINGVMQRYVGQSASADMSK